MPREKLKDTVKQLKSEIDAGAALGPEQRHVLSDALSEIETLLESEDADAPDASSLIAKLREAEAHFEESHPNLTIAVGAVADALAKGARLRCGGQRAAGNDQVIVGSCCRTAS